MAIRVTVGRTSSFRVEGRGVECGGWDCLGHRGLDTRSFARWLGIWLQTASARALSGKREMGGTGCGRDRLRAVAVFVSLADSRDGRLGTWCAAADDSGRCSVDPTSG